MIQWKSTSASPWLWCHPDLLFRFFFSQMLKHCDHNFLFFFLFNFVLLALWALRPCDPRNVVLFWIMRILGFNMTASFEYTPHRCSSHCDHKFYFSCFIFLGFNMTTVSFEDTPHPHWWVWSASAYMAPAGSHSPSKKFGSTKIILPR